MLCSTYISQRTVCAIVISVKAINGCKIIASVMIVQENGKTFVSVLNVQVSAICARFYVSVQHVNPGTISVTVVNCVRAMSVSQN